MKLIELAEKIWVKSGEGPKKKEAVMAITKKIAKKRLGDEEEWKEMETNVSDTVDGLCDVLVPNEETKVC